METNIKRHPICPNIGLFTVLWVTVVGWHVQLDSHPPCRAFRDSVVSGGNEKGLRRVEHARDAKVADQRFAGLADQNVVLEEGSKISLSSCLETLTAFKSECTMSCP